MRTNRLLYNNHLKNAGWQSHTYTLMKPHRTRASKLYPILLTMQFTLSNAAMAIEKSAVKINQLAPGYRELNYAPPIPGTYKLPKLGMANDGEVIGSQGMPTTLHKLIGGKENKVVLLSFIYSTCSDVNGCPLATAVFHKIKNRLTKEPEIAQQLTLLTLSFNPEYDTPERMKAYGATLKSAGVDWQFLTTRSGRELQPILKNYHQIAEKVFDAKGKFTGTFNHGLRVYLIDQSRQIRNIYNTELLHADIVINDIKTLLQEVKVNNPTKTNEVNPLLFRAGDNKNQYESKEYKSQSIALAQRKGIPTDLMHTIEQPPLGLPNFPVPQDNPITPEKINLGRKLFYDRRLSINNTFSCGMCHIPEQGFTSNEMATAVGVEGRSVRRNSPTLYNVAYQQTLFHDSRESTLEQQVWGPLLAHNEMANPSIGYVIDKIKQSVDYQGMFEKVFAKPPGMETIGMAIASYERALNSANSAFDRWHFGKNEQAIDAKAKRGFELFTGKAGCSQCHTIGKDYAFFTDHSLHNTGLGFEAAMTKAPDSRQRIQVAPGVYADVPNEIIDSVSAPKANDLGRYEITQKPEDRWRYKTPSLRNIALTAPYMHNGNLATLKDVVEFYNRGGIANENLDPLIKPLNLAANEINELISFLETLTGANSEKLISDAFAAPVGDSN